MPWAAAAGAVVGGLITSSGARSAASQQADATAYAADLQKQQFNKQVELQAPFRDAGLKANNRLMDLLGLSGNSIADGYGSLSKNFDASTFTTDPGYEFRLSQGQKALDRSQAARGGYFSGAALKAANDYAQNTASDEYSKAYQRYTNDQTNAYNKLAGIVNTGQGATNQLSNAAQNYGNSASGLATSQGNANAASTIASSNAWGNAFNTMGNQYQTNQLWDQYLKNKSS